MEQSDEELARLLQEQEYEAATTEHSARHSQNGSSDSPITLLDNDDVGSGDLSIDTDAPFKDLHGLFLAFNDQYFESKLSACEYCSIRLSEPLLKFRPESDYIDTLLHEMIHAYLFVTKAIQDHDGHGADFTTRAKGASVDEISFQFQYHMNRINQAAGTSITIYHTFHDEVRPPQPADRWFAEHQATCGGTYTKISAPEPTRKKQTTNSQKNTKTEQQESKEKTFMDNFFSSTKTKGSSSSSETGSGSGSGSLPPSTSKSSSSSTRKILGPGNRLDAGQDSKQTVILIGDDVDDTMGSPRPSPREAAAEAALTRLERHLKAQNKDPPSSPPLPRTLPHKSTSDSLKRKDRSISGSEAPFALEAGTAKKFKKEERVLDHESLQDTTARTSNELSLDLESESQSVDEEEEEELVSRRRRATKSAVTSDRPSGLSSPSSSSSSQLVVTHASTNLVQCPVCSNQVEEATINDHVDLCIWRTSGEMS
ncbi:hypothetical protein BGX31_006022 [Mortierella sp. GBA43]|nr:hypothetical protein BGX31_006022 [Mortierella sp. GBA43]